VDKSVEQLRIEYAAYVKFSVDHELTPLSYNTWKDYTIPQLQKHIDSEIAKRNNGLF